MTDSKIEAAKKLLANGVPPRDVAKNLGVFVPALHHWIPAATCGQRALNFVSCEDPL